MATERAKMVEVLSSPGYSTWVESGYDRRGAGRQEVRLRS